LVGIIDWAGARASELDGEKMLKASKLGEPAMRTEELKLGDFLSALRLDLNLEREKDVSREVGRLHLRPC
jgi:hypothetical protein